MPRIIVMSESDAERGSAILLDERVTAPELGNAHNSVELIERVGWAVHDADEDEAEVPAPGGAAGHRHERRPARLAAGEEPNRRLSAVARAVRDHEDSTRRSLRPASAADSRLYRRLRQAFRR